MAGLIGILAFAGCGGGNGQRSGTFTSAPQAEHESAVSSWSDWVISLGQQNNHCGAQASPVAGFGACTKETRDQLNQARIAALRSLPRLGTSTPCRRKAARVRELIGDVTRLLKIVSRQLNKLGTAQQPRADRLAHLTRRTNRLVKLDLGEVRILDRTLTARC
jgi:hypothetical protein